MFAKRIDFDLRPNSLADLRSQKVAGGAELFDLTLSNPTKAGLSYPCDELTALLADASSREYNPDPRGLPEAREAVSSYYQARGSEVSPDEIVITAGTSEAYSFLFRLLADPGECIMVPRPGYPLFDYLISLDGLVPVTLPLRYCEGWWYDFASIEKGREARAVIIISPGNPCGNYVRKEEIEEFARRCREGGMAMICDEVFHDFNLEGTEPPVDLLREGEFLSFILNGFSKTAGLPHVKMSWIVVRGPRELKEEALGKLELISDTFLSSSTIVQNAAEGIFKLAPRIRDSIRSRVAGNLDQLEKVCSGSRLSCLRVEGGWAAILRLPGLMDSSRWSLILLDQYRVLTHPGGFFGLDDGPFLVVSLLPEQDRFREGIGRIEEAVESFSSG